MDGLDAVVQEHLDENAQAAEPFLLHLVVGLAVVKTREAHDADELGSEAFHARDGAFRFREGRIERLRDFLAPVGDGGAEAVDFDACGVQCVRRAVELVLWEVVDVDAVDGAGFDVRPAEFLRCFDLAGEIFGGFVCKTCEIHVWLLWVIWFGEWMVKWY